MPTGDHGEEWVIDALGCDAAVLRDERRLRAVASRILAEGELRTLGDGFWHKFPGDGGVTGLVPLSESHLALHTYPESGVATFNLYCCRRGSTFAWGERLGRELGARRLVVRRLSRGRERPETTVSCWGDPGGPTAWEE
jgi:S-adenosylmethionine decarboxylase